MLRLAAQACSRLTPEARDVAEVFLRALPPFARESVRVVRLYGHQARRFEPERPFDLLVLLDVHSTQMRTALSIAASMVESETTLPVALTTVSATELEAPQPALARLLQNARREGVDLWLREAAAATSRA